MKGRADFHHYLWYGRQAFSLGQAMLDYYLGKRRINTQKKNPILRKDVTYKRMSYIDQICVTLKNEAGFTATNVACEQARAVITKANSSIRARAKMPKLLVNVENANLKNQKTN